MKLIVRDEGEATEIERMLLLTVKCVINNMDLHPLERDTLIIVLHRLRNSIVVDGARESKEGDGE